MGNPLSKPCYFRGQYTPDYNEYKEHPRDAIGTLHPIHDHRGNYHYWVKVGSKLIDPTAAMLDPPDYAACTEPLYFEFDRDMAAELTAALHEELRQEYGVHLDAALVSRALARNYPAGNCYENSLAYQRLHGGQLVCGAMGYKSYDALKIRGKIAVRPDGACIDDKHKPVVMLDHGL
eukprot:COSAG03_NODE_109_length_12541_cov_147.127070_18_plen_177_part_00